MWQDVAVTWECLARRTLLQPHSAAAQLHTAAPASTCLLHWRALHVALALRMRLMLTATGEGCKLWQAIYGIE